MANIVQPNSWQQLRQFTPARIALGRVGNSLPTGEVLRFGIAHALAQDAVRLPLDVAMLESALRNAHWRTLRVHSRASDRATYLLRPDYGRRLNDASAAALVGHADKSCDLVFVAAYDELASPPSPAVLVIEDAHWADGATLDVLRYLGPRVQNLPAVLLVTYRDDALTRDHPLRGVLGVLGSTAATRLRLTRLSPDAVREMAASTKPLGPQTNVAG